MKQLTLDLYERIIDATYEQSKQNINLLGSVTRDECANYIAFYAAHNGLFWSEQNGIISGVATAHPSCCDFDYHWHRVDNVWTAHMVWVINKRALAELISNFLQSCLNPVYKFYAWRKDSPTELTATKLERILFYGKHARKQNPINSSSISSTKLQ